MKEVLTLVTVLVMLSATTTLAQDMCDDYYNKYQICTEKRDAGSSVEDPTSPDSCYFGGYTCC